MGRYQDEDSFAEFVKWYDHGKGFTLDGKEQVDFLLQYCLNLRRQVDTLEGDVKRLSMGKWAPDKEQLQLDMPPQPSKYPQFSIGNTYPVKDLPMFSKVKYHEKGTVLGIIDRTPTEVIFSNLGWDHPNSYMILVELPE